MYSESIASMLRCEEKDTKLAMKQRGRRGLSSKSDELGGKLHYFRAEEAVFKASLTELRSAFNHLKASLDELEVTISEHRSVIEAVEAEKDKWATD